MKLKCNVCKESPTTDIKVKPDYAGQLICCGNCDKQLAYATENNHTHKLTWRPIDTTFNKDFGGCPVSVIT